MRSTFVCVFVDRLFSELRGTVTGESWLQVPTQRRFRVNQPRYLGDRADSGAAIRIRSRGQRRGVIEWEPFGGDDALVFEYRADAGEYLQEHLVVLLESLRGFNEAWHLA